MTARQSKSFVGSSSSFFLGGGGVIFAPRIGIAKRFSLLMNLNENETMMFIVHGSYALACDSLKRAISLLIFQYFLDHYCGLSNNCPIFSNKSWNEVVQGSIENLGYEWPSWLTLRALSLARSSPMTTQKGSWWKQDLVFLVVVFCSRNGHESETRQGRDRQRCAFRADPCAKEKENPTWSWHRPTNARAFCSGADDWPFD